MKNFLQALKWTGIILIIPLMIQWTIGTGIDGQGWNWKLGDFIFTGVFFTALQLVFRSITEKMRTENSRMAAGVLVILFFAALWVHAAVGIPFLERIIPGGS
jgi:hypothetical protein